MRHFPCQPLPEFSVFLYAAFRFRGRKRKLKYMSSLHKSPPMSASYLKWTVSKAWRQIHFFFSCLCHSCSLRQLGWETNFLPVRKEKKNQKQKHFWTSSSEALLGFGHCVYCRAEWWRLSSCPQPLQQLGSAPKCVGQERGRSSEAPRFAAELR